MFDGNRLILSGLITGHAPGDGPAIRACRGDCVIGLFSSLTGELRYKFRVSHENQPESFTAGALSFSSDYKIYCSCKGRSNEYGVGVWDQVTGKQVDFFYEPLAWSLGDADKLQRLADFSINLLYFLFDILQVCVQKNGRSCGGHTHTKMMEKK